MSLFHRHHWSELNHAHRYCSGCGRIERRDGEKWHNVPGVTKHNWHIFARRIILDGCDSLAEHRAMLSHKVGQDA